MSGLTSQQTITIRNLLSDTLIYGAAGVASRVIGFLLLPVTTAILDPDDYGVLGLFGATASILWLFSSVGVPSAFYRFYAETTAARRRARLVGSSLLLCLLQSLLAMCLGVVWGSQVSVSLFGIEAAWPTILLVTNAVCTTFIALGTARLQADGLAWRYLMVNLTSVLGSRGVGLILLLLGYGPWGWIIGELLGLVLTLPLLAVLAWPSAWPQVDARVMGRTFWYGLLLTPAFVSQWLMVGCDKLIIKATLPHADQAIGFYSVGERISSIVMFGNVAFALAWRRFAFRNMVHPEGVPLLARGMKLYVLASGVAAMALALLGDDLTHWLIRAVFAEGTVVIVPLTLAGALAGLADTANVGLHRVQRPGLISMINVGAAVLNVGLNFWAIPRFGILGAAYTTLASQALRTSAVWVASQAVFPLPLDYAGTGLALSWLAGVFGLSWFAGAWCIEQWSSPWGWAAATAVESWGVVCAVVGLWWLPVFDREERAAILRMLRDVTRRRGGSEEPRAGG